MKTDLLNKIFLSVLMLSVVVVVVAAGYKFLWLKDYNFIVEAECDPTSENCFHRDCSNAEDCPPNGLENYRLFEVPASDFPKCMDSSCARECSKKSISCQEIDCGETESDECSVPEIPRSTTENTEALTGDEEENYIQTQ